MQTTLVNRRASLPASLKAFCDQWKLSPADLLSVNPKTEKSEVQTYILHFAPYDTSGVNMCAGAGNCKKICLHFAGNPVYMSGKGACRIRKTQAFNSDPQNFLELLTVAILMKRFKLEASEPMACRLNGTSDIPWEELAFSVSADFARYLLIKFGLSVETKTYGSVLEFFNALSLNIEFYDYTKLRRNWAKCQKLGYHLTFSFDGKTNLSNIKICQDALKHGVNVAAAFDIKKGKPLPDFIDASLFYGLAANNGKLKVYDGDLTDHRPSDPSHGVIIGLRFKLPHGTPYTAADRQAFCIA
jgi:hypothetical protein